MARKVTPLTERKKLDELVEKSERKLLEVKTVFPFTIFRDSVILDTHKVDIIYGLFFFTRENFPMFYKDLRTVTAVAGIFFGQLTFELIGFEENPTSIKWLWREDAVKARRTIIGMIAVHKEGIDVSKLSEEEILAKAQEIGTAREGATQLG